MKPIRILQVVTIMNRGGLETMLMNYYRQIDRSKIQFDFLVHRTEQGHYDEEIQNLGGEIFRMPPIRPGNYKLYFKMLDDFFLVNKQYKVVHSHINENSSFILNAAKKAGIPCRIAHSHLSDLGLDIKLPFRLYARSKFKDNPTDYFACSDKAGSWLFRKKKNNVKVLPNAVCADDFILNEVIRTSVRRELGVEGKFVIGHIGRFNKQKNHEFLIKVFSEIVKEKPNSLLLMVGEGHLKKRIENMVEGLGLKEHVMFLGVREDISRLFQAFDLFLFPSLFEGLPVVLVEAQAAGLPCVVSNTITQETNFTGKLNYINLKKSPSYWAEQVLDLPLKREDNRDILKKKGYDTVSTANWLTGFYFGKINQFVK